jgi:hypothetical protein
MRRVILATAFVALTPLAFAQSNTAPMGGMAAPGTPGSMGNMGGMSAPGAQGSMGNMGGMNSMGRTGASSAAPMMGQASPGNCGTPDEPKPCPPMPRRALQNYPANRQ